MRRNDREVTDMKEILHIMDQCDVINLAFADGGEPYVVPVNFGYAAGDDGQVVFYIHGAADGKKLSLARKTGKAAFSMYAFHVLELAEKGEPACRSTMKYSSVCGTGKIEVVEDEEEKRRGLGVIMGQYGEPEGEEFDFEDDMIRRVSVMRLTVQEIFGKTNRK